VNHRQLINGADRPSFALPGFPPDSFERREEANALSVTVVFTTVPATLIALQRGGELARQLGARIRILVPQVVPYPLPLDRPQVDPKFKVRHFRTLSVDGAIETRIDVWLCRDPYDAFMQGLSPRSVVLIGGRKRWWPTREKGLAKTLSLAGHHVIFVPQT
jgi:hypothetical protein